MATELQEAMTAGVYVEFLNDQGVVQGQGVFAPWRAPSLAQVGDTLVCMVTPPGSGRRIKLRGRVCRRQFEIQQDANGQPCVWARLEARVLDTLTPTNLPAINSPAPNAAATNSTLSKEATPLKHETGPAGTVWRFSDN